jgi:hypothetical protein
MNYRVLTLVAVKSGPCICTFSSDEPHSPNSGTILDVVPVSALCTWGAVGARVQIDLAGFDHPFVLVFGRALHCASLSLGTGAYGHR